MSSSIENFSATINPELVHLPDDGFLPKANSGTKAMWYGESSTGTFIGSDFESISQTSLNGGRSTSLKTGSLTSPLINLVGINNAKLEFSTWWEIEGVDSHKFVSINKERI